MNAGTAQSNGPGIQQGGLNVGPQPNSSGLIPSQYQAVYVPKGISPCCGAYKEC